MATKSRLDDTPRMTIYREYRDKLRDLVFEYRTPTVKERERLMGFKEGYVGEAGMYPSVLDHLFSKNCLIWHINSLTAS
jgi:hypothetical protein